MNNQRIDELTDDEFQMMASDMLSDDFDKVTATEFFGVLAAMDESEPEVIELTAHTEGGQLVFEQPAPIQVERNEILFHDKRIVIKLRESAEVSL
jgi:hypothetical protein